MPKFLTNHRTSLQKQADAEAAARLSGRTTSGWGSRYLPRFKTVGKKRYQLHATRGWKCIGDAK